MAASFHSKVTFIIPQVLCIIIHRANPWDVFLEHQWQQHHCKRQIHQRVNNSNHQTDDKTNERAESF